MADNTCMWTMQQFKNWLLKEQTDAENRCGKATQVDTRNYYSGISTGFHLVLDQFWRLPNA